MTAPCRWPNAFGSAAPPRIRSRTTPQASLASPSRAVSRAGVPRRRGRASYPAALLLDEPSNHLDVLSIRWLEKFLRDFPGPVLVISHDHRFLDNVVTTILDVDYQTVRSYPGNYTAFLEAKQAERDRRLSDITAREREIAHHQKFVDRFKAKASKARQAQSKVRM